MVKAAVVTGSSSGIGYETSLILARNQIKTYATMRNMSKSDGANKNCLGGKSPTKRSSIRCKRRFIRK
jgi:NAD(P)-dependent dehydrogenase (short-subunit alcohol dehydrogenase family)